MLISFVLRKGKLVCTGTAASFSNSSSTEHSKALLISSYISVFIMKTLRNIELSCGLVLWPSFQCYALYLCSAEGNAHMVVLGPQKDVYMACVQNGSYGHMYVYK